MNPVYQTQLEFSVTCEQRTSRFGINGCRSTQRLLEKTRISGLKNASAHATLAAAKILYQNGLGEMSVSLMQCIKTSGPDQDQRGHEAIKAEERNLKNFLHLIFVGCFTRVSASYFYNFLLFKRREKKKKQLQEEKKKSLLG